MGSAHERRCPVVCFCDTLGQPNRESGVGGPMPWTRRGFVAGLLAALCAASTAAHAQDSISPQALSQIQALVAEKASRTPVQQRIDSQLLAAYRMKQGMSVAQGIAALPGVWSYVKVRPGDIVQVDLRADVSPSLLTSLRKLGATIEAAFPKYQAIRARIPLASVENVAALPGVKFVEPANQATTNTGSVNSQGDAAPKARAAR